MTDLAEYSKTGLLLTGGGRFPQILDLFQGLKIGFEKFPVAVPVGTSIFKMIMIHDVTLWSKLDFINSRIDG